jgi:hypothetical protein
MARRKDDDAGVIPWTFAPENPGYVWLLAKQEAVADADMGRDPNVLSTSVTAGSVSSAKSFRQLAAPDRSDVLEQAISIYKTGATAAPNRTVAAFGRYNP